MHHLDFNEMLGVKARWELHKDTVCCFKQILEVAHLQNCSYTATFPPISQTIQIRQTRHAGNCWRSKDELISKVLMWAPTNRHTNIGWPAKTYIHQLCTNIGYRLEDPSSEWFDDHVDKSYFSIYFFLYILYYYCYYTLA